jgi:hypothetical protein
LNLGPPRYDAGLLILLFAVAVVPLKDLRTNHESVEYDVGISSRFMHKEVRVKIQNLFHIHPFTKSIWTHINVYQTFLSSP